MSQEKILVPLGPDSRDLKTVHHALALAERVKARVYLLFFRDASMKAPSLVEDACTEVIQTAREDGLQVSYHISESNYEDELLSVIESKHIDLIVMNHTETGLEKAIKRIIPLISCQVVQVRDKNDINFLS
jgi:nucleotide-binding universal stress UspA family protein